jgi:hypothetical protein
MSKTARSSILSYVAWQRYENERTMSDYFEKSWGPFLTWPLGANFDPRGEVVPQGWILFPRCEVITWGGEFYVRPSILLNNRECSPQGVNKRVKIPPKGHFSLPGAKFNP